MSEQKEFDEFKLELDRYIKIVEPYFFNGLKDQRNQYNEFLNRILIFYYFTSFVSETKIKSVDARLKSIMLLYSKSSMSLFGIYSCLFNGLVPEAAMILRSLFENLINLECILKVGSYNSPYYKMKLFDDYGHVIKWRGLKDNRILVKEGKLSQDKFDRQFESKLIVKIEENFNRVKSSFCNRKGRLKDWTWKIFESELCNRDSSIKFVSDKLGRSVDYVKLYSTISSLIHSSAIIENVVTEKDVIFLTPKFSPLIINIGGLALGYCSDMVKHVVNFLDLPSREAINNFNESYLVTVLNDF